jgi:hypothetical protein
MTPLAQKILNELTLPKKDRTFDDRCGLLAEMDDVHCFECTAVAQTAFGMTDRLNDQRIDGNDKLAFLPAPKTWIEWTDWVTPGLNGATGQIRCGILLNQGTYEDSAEVSIAQAIPTVDGRVYFASHSGTFLIPLMDNPKPDTVRVSKVFERDHGDFAANYSPFVYALLAMINTPRVIGRRQHMPHAGLQRKLAHARGLVGKFPLHAWTEIKLEVTPPRLHRSAIGEPVEARLTGAKAQHFCRCHLRVRLGQLELVTAHWRGDPALGIKQSRYRLVMPPGTGEIHA